MSKATERCYELGILEPDQTEDFYVGQALDIYNFYNNFGCYDGIQAEAITEEEQRLIDKFYEYRKAILSEYYKKKFVYDVARFKIWQESNRNYDHASFISDCGLLNNLRADFYE